LRVFLDGVFNHTSDQHAWFRESRASRDNPKRNWYIWADEPLFDCRHSYPPGAFQEQWTLDPATGQRYFHQFRAEMPDLNLNNPEVREAIKDVCRFWLDLGVDGFRLDVAHLYFENAEYCEHHPRNHEFLKELRAVLDEYDGRALVGEVAGSMAEVTPYLGNGRDELHMIFAFDVEYLAYGSLYGQWPQPVMAGLEHARALAPDGGQLALVMSNHDFFRDYGLLLRNEDWCKLESAWLLTSPGTPFLYYGQEIGMANGLVWRIDHRDSARTPMHWTGGPNGGFTTGAPWLPLAPNFRDHNVAAERDDPDSLLHHYRRLLRLRNEHPALSVGDFRRLPAAPIEAAAVARTHAEESLVIVLNFSFAPQEITVNLSNGPWPLNIGALVDLYSGRPQPALTPHNAVDYRLSLPGLGFAILAPQAP
jgi:alpha-glucosidase